MRKLPHEPDPEPFLTLRDLLPPMIDRQGEELERRHERRDAAFFAEHAELWFIQAELDHYFELPLFRVVDDIRRGLRHVRTAFDLGHRSNAWRVWDYETYALAATHRSMAHYIASLPEACWWKGSIKPVPWLLLQVRAAFALLRETDETPALLRELEGAVHGPLPFELEQDRPDMQNTCRLLQAIEARDAAAFSRSLTTREELRAERFRRENRAAPVALIDLHGLGLSRLALDRDMRIEVTSPYLPLDLLA